MHYSIAELAHNKNDMTEKCAKLISWYYYSDFRITALFCPLCLLVFDVFEQNLTIMLVTLAAGIKR